MSINEQARPGSDNGTFLYWLAGLTAALGLAFAAWPMIHSMNPSAEVRHSLTWIDLSKIPAGGRATTHWGMHRIPIYVVHRTSEQVMSVRADDDAEMPFPQSDRDRVQRAEWLVVFGLCWHGWTTPMGQEPGEPRGPWSEWQCHYGDAYDLSGRIRNRWGESNLAIPPHYFEGDNWLVIGERP